MITCSHRYCDLSIIQRVPKDNRSRRHSQPIYHTPEDAPSNIEALLEYMCEWSQEANEWSQEACEWSQEAVYSLKGPDAQQVLHESGCEHMGVLRGEQE